VLLYSPGLSTGRSLIGPSRGRCGQLKHQYKTGDDRSASKNPGEWLFAAPAGGPLRETNWQRSVSWREAKATIGRPELRVHDLRHTAASVWLASGADPKVVQRVLGHATAAMTMDLYGHMIDRNLWDAAQRLGGTTGTRQDEGPDDEGGCLAKSRD
jgi:integrase